MRTVGKRKERPISFAASASLLEEGARFNDAIHGLPTGHTTFIPKGVRFFKTHEEANRDQLEHLAIGMAKTARQRSMIKAALMVLPDKAANDIDPAWFEEGENIRVADDFVVDIMLNACGETYETLLEFAETVELDGLPIRTINLEGLLRTKQTMRDKDVSDRIILERALELFRRGANE